MKTSLKEWRLERIYDLSSLYYYKIIRLTKWGEITHGYIRKDFSYSPADSHEKLYSQTNYPLSQVPKTLLPKGTRKKENY